MREHDLSCETNTRFPSPEPDVNLCDHGESFPTLESILEEVFDPPSTTLPPVAPSLPNTLGTTLHLSRPSLIHLTL